MDYLEKMVDLARGVGKMNQRTALILFLHSRLRDGEEVAEDDRVLRKDACVYTEKGRPCLQYDRTVRVPKFVASLEIVLRIDFHALKRTLARERVQSVEVDEVRRI